MEVCGADWPGAAGSCVDCARAENGRAAATINTKNKQIDVLGTPTRIPESFPTREIARLIFLGLGLIENDGFIGIQENSLFQVPSDGTGENDFFEVPPLLHKVAD